MLRCKDCSQWYGENDNGYGPCRLKLARSKTGYVTFGGHECDEEME
ncbi:MAG: hypothetical protein QCI38_02325 [Candidatus Thermoplasmatota archaeon]|nr:hypothetical protein [Candidatus Thermoplasmatota archaeon]